jgi:hypothetical protein
MKKPELKVFLAEYILKTNTTGDVDGTREFVAKDIFRAAKKAVELAKETEVCTRITFSRDVVVA